ncbi:hypothetical protein G7K_3824-t1 [Saitoella complicata NRRL Y-17804]|uniref:Uncharacterized protein n=1 Tax=Saitoella complicata (strain BCRC 22490 / CBS 7301 / JCM 7358 / NBRC 10748 / NRRL Y-17804) TaxID=698492 RepID=A0A0E9NIN7_SAICN|nr:hypothetical protein G7K_3824-t1 [Saitoella complicata NRRL Y-17804]
MSSFDNISQLLKDRQPYRHEIIQLEPGRVLHDVVEFSTQGGSQWDGFRHVSYSNGLFYGGITMDEMLSCGLNGMHNWARKGIVGRGVLLDYYGYNPTYDPLSPSPISSPAPRPTVSTSRQETSSSSAPTSSPHTTLSPTTIDPLASPKAQDSNKARKHLDMESAVRCRGD